MKRIGNLYQKIISVENLRLADEKARRGKTWTYGVRVHDKNREANILALHEALLTKTFKTSPYDVFTIYEPKERLIFRLPYYPDRIVHHAIMNVLEPIWVKTFTYNTYSCVKGRGIEGCARQVDKIIRDFKGKPLYCLKIDIKKYYPSISHRVTKRLVRRKIKDTDLLWLLDEIIDSAEGLPIGLQLLGDCFQEKKILRAAYSYEQTRAYEHAPLALKEADGNGEGALGISGADACPGSEKGVVQR